MTTKSHLPRNVMKKLGAETEEIRTIQPRVWGTSTTAEFAVPRTKSSEAFGGQLIEGGLLAPGVVCSSNR